MSDVSTYLGNKVLRWLAGDAMPSPPDIVWLALFDGDPKGAGTEVTALVNGYGRVPMPFDVIAEGTDNLLLNALLVSFGQSENAVTLTHAAIYDGVTGGNLLMATPITAQPHAVAAGTIVEFQAGDLSFTIGD
jgi:hypothetical protein